MPLPATVDALDELPEPVRAYYLETDDGRWRLDAEGVEDVAGLKSALEKERAERKALKAALADRDAQDPQGAGEGDVPASETTDPEADPVTDPASDAPSDAPLDAPSDSPGAPAREAAIAARLIEAEARSAIRAAHGVPELLLPVVTARLSLDGDGQVVATGEDGGATSVERIVEALRADPTYGRAFDASGKGGSGAPVAGRGDAGPATVSAADPRAVARHIADIAAGRVRVT